MSQTHDVAFGPDGVVTKTYKDWSRGEPEREWAALRLLSTVLPGLVPTPLQRTATPSITMSRLPGTPLGGSLSAEQLDALADALGELWSVPPTGLALVDYDGLVVRVRAALMSESGGGIVAEALAAAREWLDGQGPSPLGEPARPVVGHGDPNLANYVWDGTRVRIVDFEDTGCGDLDAELANLVEHLASRQTRWQTLVERFPVDAERFATARRLFATFWLTLLRPGGPAAARNPPGTAEAQAERVLAMLCPRRELAVHDLDG